MENRSKLFLLIGIVAFIIISATFYIAIKPKDVVDTLVTDSDRFEIVVDRITLWDVSQGEPHQQIFTATKGEPLYEKTRKTLQQWRIKRQWFQNETPIQYHYKMALIDEERPKTTTVIWISKDDALSAYNKNYTLIHGSVHQLVTEK